MEQQGFGDDYSKLESFYIQKCVSHFILKVGWFYSLYKKRIILNFLLVFFVFLWSDRLLEIVTATKKGYMIWQEVFDNGVKVTEEKLCVILQKINKIISMLKLV